MKYKIELITNYPNPEGATPMILTGKTDNIEQLYETYLFFRECFEKPYNVWHTVRIYKNQREIKYNDLEKVLHKELTKSRKRK